MSDFDVKIEKLNKDNFQVWKFKITLLLEKRGAMGVVNGTEVKPEATKNNGDDLRAWMKKDGDAKYYIATTLEDQCVKQVITCTSAAEMWKTLSELFEKKSVARINKLQKKLVELKLGEDQTVSDYIADVKNTVALLKDTGDAGVSDAMLQVMVMNGLPKSKYAGFLNAWNCKSDGDKTFETLQNSLITAEELLKDTDEDIVAMTAAAKTKWQGKKKPQEASKENEQRADKKPFPYKCYHCGKKGHRKAECRKLKPESNSEKANTKTKAAKKDNASGNEDAVFMASANEYFERLPIKSDVWLADSGASFHMAYDPTIFETLKKSFQEFIWLGDDHKVPIIGEGTVPIEVLVDGEWKPWKLTKVVCVPDLRKNLFSYTACSDKGYEIVSDKKRVKIVRDNQIFATGIRDGSLYKMLFRQPKKLEANSTITMSRLQLIHERLGHLSATSMRQLAKRDKSLGIKIEEITDFICEACQYAKLKRNSFKLQPKKEYEPGDKIHSDVCGPFQTEATNGANYYLILKDEASEYRTVYTLKHKSDVYSKFVDFANKVKNQFGHDIKVLKTDNGREYVNSEMIKFMSARGIIHETTAPHNPEQNGKAEREIRTLSEMIRAMIFGRELPKYLWAEAVTSAAEILNKSMTSKNDKSPFQNWTGKEPNINEIRVFGSIAYAHVPDSQRKKLDHKAKKLIYVGRQGSNYRLFDMHTKKITVAASVKFDENEVKCRFSIPVEGRISEQEDVEIIEESKEDEDVVEERTEEYEPVQEEIKEHRELRDRATLKKPKRYQAHVAEVEPLTYKEAISGAQAKQWECAIQTELNAHQQNGTWYAMEKPVEKKVITCKWVFKRKETPGELIRYKARLVAKGFTQRFGVDYTETYAPVARYESLRVLLAKAANEDLDMIQFDVRTAFLYGELKEDIWIELPQGPWKDEDRIVKLAKSLYGLKQSSHCWNEKFNSTLKNFNMKQSDADDCIYIGEMDKHKIYLALYVDDGLLISKSNEVLKRFIVKLKQCFEISVSEPHYFVGIEIERDRHKKTLKVHQTTYIRKIMEKFGMNEANGIAIPVDPHLRLSKKMCPSSEEDKEMVKNKPYRELIGSLQFAVNVTRFDIAFGVNVLSRFLENPGHEHWKAAIRILRYLKDTCEQGIIYGQEGKKMFDLTAFGDADFAGDEDERRSTTGYVITLFGGPVSWASRRQKLVALSTAEAELVAASQVTQEVMWLRYLVASIEGSNHKNIKPTVLNCDNQAAIALIRNEGFHSRTKHIDVKYKFIRKATQEGTIKVVYCPTEEQLADILTKGLPKPIFVKLREILINSN